MTSVPLVQVLLNASRGPAKIGSHVYLIMDDCGLALRRPLPNGTLLVGR